MAKANAQRGQVEVEMQGETYVMEWTLNAVIGAEEMFDGVDLSKINFEDVKASQYRRLVWLALQAHHPELDEATVGSMVNMATMQTVIGSLFSVVSAAEKVMEGNGKPAGKPVKAKAAESKEPAGTGAK